MKSSCQEMNRPSKYWATVGRCAASSILSGKYLARIQREHTNHYATIVPTSAKSRNQLLDARGHQWDNSTHSGSIFQSHSCFAGGCSHGHCDGGKKRPHAETAQGKGSATFHRRQMAR